MDSPIPYSVCPKDEGGGMLSTIILLNFILILKFYSNQLIARISHDVSGGKREYTGVAEYRDVTKGNGWVRLVNEIYIEGKYSTVQLYCIECR